MESWVWRTAFIVAVVVLLVAAVTAFIDNLRWLSLGLAATGIFLFFPASDMAHMRMIGEAKDGLPQNPPFPDLRLWALGVLAGFAVPLLVTFIGAVHRFGSGDAVHVPIGDSGTGSLLGGTVAWPEFAVVFAVALPLFGVFWALVRFWESN